MVNAARGSLQRSKGLKRKGPVLIELVENTLSDGQQMPKSPQNGVRTQIFGTRTELFARADGAERLAAALRRLEIFTPNAYLHTSFYA